MAISSLDGALHPNNRRFPRQGFALPRNDKWGRLFDNLEFDEVIVWIKKLKNGLLLLAYLSQ